MRYGLAMLLICCFSLVSLACSDDSSEPSTSNNDTTDVSADSSTDTAENDITPDIEEEVEEEDPKLAAGEACPANCQSLDGGAGYARCTECHDGYCNFPVDDMVHQYCTKTCFNDSNCQALGEGWTCGDEFSVCVFEG